MEYTTTYVRIIVDFSPDLCRTMKYREATAEAGYFKSCDRPDTKAR